MFISTYAYGTNYTVDCINLQIGQYICPHPNSDLIDRTTQQIRGCSKENKARVLMHVLLRILKELVSITAKDITTACLLLQMKFNDEQLRDHVRNE
ncbi:Protein of unknown function [Cotesia congregata]|uniref:Uncharacterized protein n=1 Tax=Cotesia congregata TaxID=51543 RepID=A0A8J2HJH9_COTCN|nr:Protein of unknown function [Cotesia congregata]